MQKEGWSIVSLNVVLPLYFKVFSCSAYIFNLNEINLRHHALAFVKQVTELLKYVMPFYEAGKGHEEVLRHMLNPASENPFDWNVFPLPGLSLEEDEKEMILTEVKHFLEAWLGDANNNEDDIPLD